MVKKVKRVLRFAEDYGERVNQAYKSTSFKAQEEAADNIYLDRSELQAMASLAIPDQNRSMLKSRDLFLIGCYTGLRVSDYTRLSKDHIVILDGMDFFEIESRKTGRLVTIPIHPQVRDIIETNNGALPSVNRSKSSTRTSKSLGLWQASTLL